MPDKALTPQDEKELLLRVVTKLAATQLEAKGFMPFGATLGPHRNVKLLAPQTWKQNSNREEVETYWVQELRKAITSEECKAVCFCADVRVPVDNGGLVPAVLIHVEHAEAPAEAIFYPYSKDGSLKVVFASPTRAATTGRIFRSSEGTE